MQDILNLPLGLLLGLLNERANMGNGKEEDEVIQGDASMLMRF